MCTKLCFWRLASKLAQGGSPRLARSRRTISETRIRFIRLGVRPGPQTDKPCATIGVQSFVKVSTITTGFSQWRSSRRTTGATMRMRIDFRSLRQSTPKESEKPNLSTFQTSIKCQFPCLLAGRTRLVLRRKRIEVSAKLGLTWYIGTTIPSGLTQILEIDRTMTMYNSSLNSSKYRQSKKLEPADKTFFCSDKFLNHLHIHLLKLIMNHLITYASCLASEL